jgi:hypothetical protein
VADLEELAARLETVAEDLADAALDRLRRNADAVAAGETPDPGLVAEEKRLTRARRAVEKAVALVGGVPGVGVDDGP